MSDPRSPTHPRPGQLAAHLALIGAQVSFGLFPVFGQFVFRPGGLTPLGLGTWRLAAGAVILALIAAVRYRRDAIPNRADLARLALAAMLGVAVNQGLFLEGLARSTPINATLVMCLIPVFTFTIAAAVGVETFSARRLVGVLIALGGTLPLLFDDGFHSLGRHGLGNLFMVANSLCYSVYLVMAKPLVRRYPPIVVIAWAYIFSLPFVPFFAVGQRLVPAAGHPLVWWSILYTVLFPTVLAYLFNMFALSRVRASTAATYIYAQPLVSAVASWFAFGEQPTAAMFIAAAALFSGVWLVREEAAAV